MTEGHDGAGALDFAAFLDVVMERTGLGAEGDGIGEDTPLDSFQVLELVVLCEDLAGVVPADGPLPVTSLRDAHQYLTDLARTPT